VSTQAVDHTSASIRTRLSSPANGLTRQHYRNDTECAPRRTARSSPNVPLGKVGSRFSQFGPQGGRPPWPAAQVVKSFQYLLTDPRQFDILKSALAGPGPNASRSIETARVHIAARRHGGGVAACGARAQQLAIPVIGFLSARSPEAACGRDAVAVPAADLSLDRGAHRSHRWRSPSTLRQSVP
jgi:hypothetical protein